MHQSQRQQTTDLLRNRGIRYALFASPDHVKWLTGFAPSVELGHWHFFAGGPALVWYDDGHFTLIAVEAHQDYAAALAGDTDIQVVTYAAYTIEEPINSAANLARVLTTVIRQSKPHGKTGIEAVYLTAHLQQVLLAAAGQDLVLEEVSPLLIPLRMIKTAEELEKLRYNFRLADLGHQIARQETRPGQREIDVWLAIDTAIQREVGERVALGNDCVVNYRTPNNIGGFPADLELHPGDSLTVDISTIHRGYWSDSCMTYYATEPDAEQRAAHQVVQQALDYGISLVRPGVRANEIDRLLRAFMANAGYEVYPHHSGHGVGVAGHEAPRIVPYDDTPLAPGMVLMLEPGIYVPGKISVRLEDGLLVTSDGVEILTTHDKRLPD